eukprot:212017-Chlamydomonas_euryale.AAC.2
MDGWMDGWMGGCMDGWMGGWMDGWMDDWCSDQALGHRACKRCPPTAALPMGGCRVWPVLSRLPCGQEKADRLGVRPCGRASAAFCGVPRPSPPISPHMERRCAAGCGHAPVLP